MSEQKEKKQVIFICTHNSARSQMAEGLLRAMFGERYEVYSAGTVATEVNPYAVRVMAEIGIDISHHRSKTIDELKGKNFDLVVTLCGKAQSCPFLPGAKRYLHQEFEDPSEITGSEKEILAGFRQIRDELKNWINNTFNQERGQDGKEKT